MTHDDLFSTVIINKQTQTQKKNFGKRWNQTNWLEAVV